MDEAKWRKSSHPGPMLEFLRGRISPRKLRLFACCCCWGIEQLLTDERSQEAVEVAGLFAEGEASDEELAAAAEEASHADSQGNLALLMAGRAAQNTALQPGVIPSREGDSIVGPEAVAAFAALAVGYAQPHSGDKARKAEERTQAILLREIVGNPFRPISFEPRWRTKKVRASAGAMYEAWDFDAMAELAEALEEAGCTDEAILGHCREEEGHVRGCWVLDLVLGKE